MVMTSSCVEPSAGKLAQCGAEGLLDDTTLAVLLAADAAQLGGGVVGERAVGHDLAFDGFGQRAQVAGEIHGKLVQAREPAGDACRRFAQQRLPGGDVVGEAGDGLQFGSFESDFGDARLVGELGGIEEAAERDGDLLLDQKADFAGELMLVRDPCLVSGGLEGENGRAADRRSGETGHQRQQRLPLESGEVGVRDGRRDGIEQRHGQIPSYGFL